MLTLSSPLASQKFMNAQPLRAILTVLGILCGKLLNYIFYTREIKAESLDWSQRAYIYIIMRLCFTAGEKRTSGEAPILENKDVVYKGE